MKKAVLVTLGAIGLVSAGVTLYFKGRKDELEEMSKEIEKISEQYGVKPKKKPGRPKKNTSENKAEENKSE